MRTTTKTCPARHKDRFLTIHECSLDGDHGGYHRTVDGLMFYDEEQVRLRRVPVRAEQYTDPDATGVVRELVELLVDDGAMGGLLVRLNPEEYPTRIWPGEWLVQYDDASVERWYSDRFAEQFEICPCTPGAPAHEHGKGGYAT